MSDPRATIRMRPEGSGTWARKLRVPKANDALIGELYTKRRLSLREIAQKHSPRICPTTVRQSLERQGIARRPVGDLDGKARRRRADDALVAKLYQCGLSLREVARVHSPRICPATVRAALERQGITRRPVGDVEAKGGWGAHQRRRRRGRS